MPKADLPIYPAKLPLMVAKDGLRIREDVLYTNAKGEDHDRRRRNAERSLVTLKDILPSVLEPDEAILYVVKRCQSPLSAFEQFMLGWHAYFITATTLVFTNLRLIHLSVDSRGNWTQTLKTVHWGDISEAKVKGWLSPMLKLKYANGKKENYWRIPRKDGKKIKDILGTVMPASRGEATAQQGMISLCPDCRTPLTPGVYRCNQCGLTFRDEKTLLKWTLLMPGGGFLYAKIWFLGVAGFVVAGAFLLATLFFVLIAVGILPAETDKTGHIPSRGELWGPAIFGLLIVALQKLLEFHHSRRVIRNFRPMKRPGQA
jgi:hypothetical protein